MSSLLIAVGWGLLGLLVGSAVSRIAAAQRKERGDW